MVDTYSSKDLPTDILRGGGTLAKNRTLAEDIEERARAAPLLRRREPTERGAGAKVQRRPKGEGGSRIAVGGGGVDLPF
jgi:hypothetical protein